MIEKKEYKLHEYDSVLEDRNNFNIPHEKNIYFKKPGSKTVCKIDKSFYQKACSYHKSNEIDKAIVMYNEIIEKNPLYKEVRFNLAAAYIQKAMFHQAITILKELLNCRYNNSKVLLNIAIAEIGIGMSDKALVHLNKAESKTAVPDYRIYYHRGVAYSKINKFSEAIIWYNKAQSLDPDNPNIYFNLGIIYEKSKKYSEAVYNYKQAVAFKNAFSDELKSKINKRIRDIMLYKE